MSLNTVLEQMNLERVAIEEFRRDLRNQQIKTSAFGFGYALALIGVTAYKIKTSTK